ncbi:hypothetical protein [Phaeobacter inhibens]|uniref:hypothetical protein n=1 Tax=Phaeobacter inhibens TaxID=221822 RepID=UPI00249268F4|nr:hypothetical protein [Phaeobacter inhibens]
MTNLVISWGLAITIVAIVWWVVKTYLQLKPVGTGLTALAVKEFHDSCDSLMKTPQELPEEVLEALLYMGRNALEKGSHWKLRNAIRQDRRGKPISEASSALKASVEGMRPELRELFLKATASWMNIMCNRSLLGGVLISHELHKIQLQKGATRATAEKEAMRVLPDLGGCLT